jgi:hypothetical protein
MTITAEITSIYDNRRHFEPAIHWFELDAGYRASVIRDGHLNIIEMPTQYGISLAKSLRQQGRRESAHVSRTAGAAYATRDFSCFMEKKSHSWEKIDDAMLIEYREWSLANRKSKGKIKDELSAKRSTNVYLREIYYMLHWSQNTAQMAVGLIGESKCRVRSTLGNNEKDAKGNRKSERYRFPLLYRGVGEKARHSAHKHWATQDELNQIEQYFKDTLPAHLAERNVVMMHLADGEAWRRSSIHSLTTKDFTGKLEENEKDGSIRIAPSFQKMERQFSFDVPYEMVRMVREYIANGRQHIADRFGIKTDALFLSENTGKSLSLSAITHIFRDAFAAIGVEEPNAGIHSIRRKSAQDKTDSIMEYRKANGLPITEKDIQFDLSKLLGQESLLSSEAYRRRESRMHDESLGARQQRAILAKDAENFELRQELQRIRAEVESLRASVTHKPEAPTAKRKPHVAQQKSSSRRK